MSNLPRHIAWLPVWAARFGCSVTRSTLRTTIWRDHREVTIDDDGCLTHAGEPITLAEAMGLLDLPPRRP